MAINETTKEKHIKNKDIKIRTNIIVVSDSLSSMTEQERKLKDRSSKIAVQQLMENGCEVNNIRYCPDEIELIRKLVNDGIDNGIELIITIGGTGIAQRDVTIEAVEVLLAKKLPGYGELFRHLTYQEVGTVSIMTRAIAGVNKNSVIVCLPGSPNAVRLGVSLILKEIIHIQNLLAKK